MTPKFKIGDQVYRPTFENHETSVACPDCGGTGRLRVTFADDTTVSIGCANCASGYDVPTGRVKCYDRFPEAKLATISGIEMDCGKIKYKLYAGPHSYWRVEESDLSTDHAAAMIKARAMADKWSEDERARIYRKERDTRTWAWNASYHRNAIKKAQKDIEYHTAKLNVATIKAKDNKATKAKKEHASDAVAEPEGRSA